MESVTDCTLNKMRKSLVFALLLILSISCSKENAPDCFTSNGKDVSEIRHPGTFKAIMVPDKFEVDIIKGAEFKVEVICGENIIRNISTQVKNDTLTLENKNRCNFVRGYKRIQRISITVIDLAYLENNGVGIVTFDKAFKQDSLSVRVSSSGDVYINGEYHSIKTSSNGNGDIYMSGTTNNLYVYTNGINFVRAQGLSVSDYMFIHTANIGDCLVNASGTKKFDYNIQNSGNIYYTGDPLEMVNFSTGEAKGKIIKE